MSKFKTFWGDLNVGNIEEAPAAEAQSEKKEEADATAAAEEAASAEADAEEDLESGEEPAKEDEKSKKEEEEEEEEYEYSDDDISKAYSMLVEEDVLDVPEGEEFENSTSGLADAVAATVRKKLKDEIAAIPPVVQEFYAHVTGGNSPDTFKSEVRVSWKDLDITEEDAQVEALRALYTSQNMSAEDIEEEIEDVKTAGKLEKKAALAKNILTAAEEKDEQAKILAQTEATKAAEDKARKDIEDVEKSIDTLDEVAGFKLDDKKKKNFKDYLFKVNPRTGKTQMQENMGDESRRLKIAFLDFVEFTKADLTKEEATKLTKTRRKKLVKFSDKNTKNVNSSKTVKAAGENRSGKLVLPSIFGSSEIQIED